MLHANQDPMERFSSTYSRLKDEGASSISGYVLFSSHTDALALFQASKEEGVPARISPTPRDARASCGVALLIPCDQAERMHSIAQERGIPIESMVALPNQINAHRDKYC